MVSTKKLVTISAIGTMAFLLLHALSASSPYKEPEVASSSSFTIDPKNGEVQEEIFQQNVDQHPDIAFEEQQEMTGNGGETKDEYVEILGGVITTIQEEELSARDINFSPEQISYYHCGPPFGRMTQDQQYQYQSSGQSFKELLLLHGAAFSKETWKETGILQQLCQADGSLSVTAVDLSVKSTGDKLIALLNGLKQEGIISGNPLVIVSPSASGKAISTLADRIDGISLKKHMKGWIPVACSSVLKIREGAISEFVHQEVPVLAIYGDQDAMGKKASQKLKSIANAEVLELPGQHPVYLDSPQEFVNFLILFVNQVTS